MVYENTQLLHPPPFALLPINLSMTVKSIDSLYLRANLTIRAEGGVAAFVFVQTPFDGRWSDNGFHLLPGYDREILFHFQSHTVETLPDVEAFQRSLDVRSLEDTYLTR